ncbi:hypothetical protein RM96_18610 [Cupriavidus sp. IDO]|nr:hypothetical protein RM96_18610 [Cupriavidus sp. IDO]
MQVAADAHPRCECFQDRHNLARESALPEHRLGQIKTEDAFAHEDAKDFILMWAIEDPIASWA